MKKVKKARRKSNVNQAAKQSPIRNGKVIHVPLPVKKIPKKKSKGNIKKRIAIVQLKRKFAESPINIEMLMLNFPKITHRRLTIS